MTDCGQMLALAERCEKATDRELDAMIVEALDPRRKPEDRVMYYGKPTGEHVDHDEDRMFIRSPAFTASLDAAMTLAEGLERFGGAAAMLRQAMDNATELPRLMGAIPPDEYRQIIARYFTAACLRARAAKEKVNG